MVNALEAGITSVTEIPNAQYDWVALSAKLEFDKLGRVLGALERLEGFERSTGRGGIGTYNGLLEGSYQTGLFHFELDYGRLPNKVERALILESEEQALEEYVSDPVPGK